MDSGSCRGRTSQVGLTILDPLQGSDRAPEKLGHLPERVVVFQQEYDCTLFFVLNHVDVVVMIPFYFNDFCQYLIVISVFYVIDWMIQEFFFPGIIAVEPGQEDTLRFAWYGDNDAMGDLDRAYPVRAEFADFVVRFQYVDSIYILSMRIPATFFSRGTQVIVQFFSCRSFFASLHSVCR